jgi:hypothetical protein
MVFTKLWWKAAAVRAIKTMCQTAIAIIPAAVTITAVDWLTVVGTAALAGVMSILTSLAGLPEVTERNELAGDKGRITVLAYDEYDEDGSPIVDKPCDACDLSQYVDDGGGEDNADR